MEKELSKRKTHEQLIKDLYRYLAFKTAPNVVRIGISANQITILRIPFIILGSLSIVFLDQINNFALVIASLSLLFFSFFDALDGEVATLKLKTFIGRWLDPQIDRFGLSLIFISTIIYYLNKGDSSFQIILFTSSCTLWWMTSTALADIAYKPKFLEIRNIKNENLTKTKKKEAFKDKKNKLKTKIISLLKFLSLNTYMHSHNIILLLITSIIFKELSIFVYLFFLRVLFSYLRTILKQSNKIISFDKKI